VTPIPFGNDPLKLHRYRAFWRRDSVSRPLVGFTFVGWFPLGEFAVARAWSARPELTPDMLDIGEVLDDHERMVREGELIRDDLIRGASPMQVAVPFLPAMLGARLRILPESVLGEELSLSWEDAMATRLEPASPWYRRYFELADALVERAAGRFPVSHSAEIGPSDVHAALRGHTRAIEDLVDSPEQSRELIEHAAGIFRELTEALWRRVPLFHGGWFDAQYSLWAPEPIARLQEDASAVYSPALYRRLVAPADRLLAAHFPCAFMHLHSTSVFLLDAFLEIAELRCFEINIDAAGPSAGAMIPFFRRVQEAGRSLLVRGALSPEELRLMLDSLDPRGLMLLVMVRDRREAEELGRVAGV
jgi:hypothetical protein